MDFYLQIFIKVYNSIGFKNDEEEDKQDKTISTQKVKISEEVINSEYQILTQTYEENQEKQVFKTSESMIAKVGNNELTNDLDLEIQKLNKLDLIKELLFKKLYTKSCIVRSSFKFFQRHCHSFLYNFLSEKSYYFIAYHLDGNCKNCQNNFSKLSQHKNVIIK